jgi:membrane protein insertase Oxa1/YidC/SpoIIIJ
MSTFWRWVIDDLFRFVGNYGWRVVVLTVCLKLLLSPLDFFMRKKGRDNAKILKRIQPELDRLSKAYAGDPSLTRRKAALQKANGYSMGASCLPMIITMFLFITLFTGFTQMSQSMNIDTFRHLEGTYNTTMNAALETPQVIVDAIPEYGDFLVELAIGEQAKAQAAANFERDFPESIRTVEVLFVLQDATDRDGNPIMDPVLDENGEPVLGGDGEPMYEVRQVWTYERQINRLRQFLGQQAAAEEFEERRESFLWITNVWRSDTWNNPIPTAEQYAAMVGDTVASANYDRVMRIVIHNYRGSWNGILILVILAVGLNLANQLMMRKQQKAQTGAMPGMGGGGMMKVMMFMMPLMIGFFALSQSSTFTLYMVVNAFMTMVINLSANGILKAMENKKGDDDSGGKKAKIKTAKARKL